MMRGKSFKKERTHHGTMRTKVVFSRMTVGGGFYDEDVEAEEQFTAWAEVFNTRHEDMEDLKGRFTKNALALESIKSTAINSLLSLKIRDPLQSFQVKNSDNVKIKDVRYQGTKWEVIDIRPDFYDRRFLIVHLKAV